ncbi:hypothetical protein [Bacillus sp. 1P02SD]|uniref:hypothetical protein n=1 Tax=Bacillus sp. 1P02SD TaxID=3132264 RepID=UPI0039A22ED5
MIHKEWATVGDLYLDAIEYNAQPLLLLLDFLLYEKSAIGMEESTSELDRYFAEKNKARMNQLLDEYKQKLGGKQ